jgi:hypothetical protein
MYALASIFGITPIYIFFIFIFFFRKHKQKITILGEKSEYQNVFFNTTIFSVGYHAPAMTGENASSIFKA